MVIRKRLSACVALALSFSCVVGAAPTKQDLEAVQMVFDYNASDDLAYLEACGKPALRNQYLQSMHDAGAAYPNRDPQKIRALIRDIERRADSRVQLQSSLWNFLDQKDIDEDCKFNIGQALKRLNTLDDFIFKS